MLTLLRPSGAAPVFPTVTLRDNFNRADAASLGANWTTIFTGDGVVSPVILSNGAAVADTTSFAGAAWNVDDFGPDVAVSIEIKTAPTGTWVIDLYGRLAHDESGLYSIFTNDTGEMGIFALGVDFTPLNITLAAPLTVGDKLGLVIRGTALEAWVYQSGAWSRKIQATDATYSAAGWVAFDVLDDGGTLAIDNFSAATL